MNEIKFNLMRQQIIESLNNINYRGDLSDLGNEIGIVIGKYICTDLGYDLDGFINGLKHGISLTNGTHK